MTNKALKGGITLAGLIFAFTGGPAAADAIDGNWCDGRGHHLSIDGPAIVTPGGTRMTGDYDRHGFRYVVPPNEPGAGKQVVMALLNEETMELSVYAAGGSAPEGQAETWQRCELTT